MEMSKLEKVIKWFEYDYFPRIGAYRKDCKQGCDACMSMHDGDDYCDIDMLCKILALLKEHEARILDLDELENWNNAVWFEDKDEQDCYIALTANVGTYDTTFVNVEPGKFHRLIFLREFYKKEWRCWSAEPTAKQRQEVKWNDESRSN